MSRRKGKGKGKGKCIRIIYYVKCVPKQNDLASVQVTLSSSNSRVLPGPEYTTFNDSVPPPAGRPESLQHRYNYTASSIHVQKIERSHTFTMAKLNGTYITVYTINNYRVIHYTGKLMM